MKQAKKAFLTFASFTLLTGWIPAVAQEKPEPAKKSREMTLTGCLNKGEQRESLHIHRI